MTTKHSIVRPLLAAALGLALFGSALAAPSGAEQRVQEELQLALLRLVDTGEITADELARVKLDSPASRTPVFGAIIDARYRTESDRDGLPVAAVTPGGSADKLGLRSGDRLLAVNGETLLALGDDGQGRAVAAKRFRDALQASGAAGIAVRVARAGGETELRGPVRVVALPAYRLELGSALAGATLAAGAGGGDGVSACGRVSVFDAAPRGKKIYPAVLIGIDGKTPGPTSSEVFRLEPGRRRLTVAEDIDGEEFTGIEQNVRNRPARDRYKDLMVDVQPGVTYRLGSQLVLENRNRIRDNSYWEPVIYSEVAETCR